MVQIAVDARCLNTEHLRGIGKCLWELISRADSRKHLRWFLFSDRPDLPFHRPTNANVDVEIFPLKGFRIRSWEQAGLPWKVFKLKPDLLYCPASTAPLWQPAPTIIKLHDVIPWLGDEDGWPRGVHTDRVLPAAFKRSAAIVTISEGSRSDIVRLWPALQEKTHVVPDGVGEAYLSASAGDVARVVEQYGLRQPFVLYFGGTNARKRLDWAFEVMERLNDPTVQLAVCGVEASQHEIWRTRASGSIREQVRFLPYVPEADMPSLYSGAATVLYPTLYEGFGLPALEAQAVGTPVVFANVNGLSELTGPGAVVVPVADLSAWSAAVARLVQARSVDMIPNQAARAWAANFSWERYSSRMFAVWSGVLGISLNP